MHRRLVKAWPDSVLRVRNQREGPSRNGRLYNNAGMPQHQAEEASLPPPFLEWVAGKRASDNPRGDFIRDARRILKQEVPETDLGWRMAGACPEARSEYQKLESEYRRRFGAGPSDPDYRHRREQAVGLSWYDIRWRALPYVIYICRNGNIVLGNRSYLPLWVWERELGSQVGNPNWQPVNERAFVRGIVRTKTRHTYNDGNCGLPRRKMIAHVNAKLKAFGLHGLPPNWDQHRQATDRKAWDACYSPPEEDEGHCGGITLDYG